MYNILENTFQSTLEREGKIITINNINHTVFFRRNDGSNNPNAYTTLYAPLDAQIKQGEQFTIGVDKYLILVDLTAENDIYRKYKAIRTNSIVKWMFGKNNLVLFDVFMNDVSESINTKTAITLSSKVDFMITLDDNSRKIKVNGRFFCGSFHAVWKVLDINYLNGICYLSAERDSVLTNDDTKNGIANRYDYDPRPSTYKVVFDNIETITIEELEEEIVKYTIYKDDVPMDNPPLSQTFLVEGGSYMLADDIDTTGTETVTEEYFKIHINNDNVSVKIEQGQIVIMGMIIGTSKITASYHQSEDDTIITDSIDVTIIKKSVVPSEINITPPYDRTDHYYLRQGFDELYRCNITGVDAIKWKITVNPNGNTATNYTATIDNNLGTFTIINKKMSSYMLIVNIIEETSGKTAEYKIKLAGMF